MIDLQLDIIGLTDLAHENNHFMQSEFLNFANKHLAAGNRIIIKRSYVNAPADFIRVFADKNGFALFWNKLFDSNA